MDYRAHLYAPGCAVLPFRDTFRCVWEAAAGRDGIARATRTLGGAAPTGRSGVFVATGARRHHPGRNHQTPATAPVAAAAYAPLYGAGCAQSSATCGLGCQQHAAARR